MVWLKRDSPAQVSRRTRLDKPVSPPREAAAPAPASSDVLPRLRKLIEEGRFAPGSRMPPERTLAAQLGVGRPALREAIKVLSGLGVLESRRGSGTFLRSTDFCFPAAAVGVLDLLEVRKIIEPRAAALAATRADERQLVEIENARQRLELHDRDWKLVSRLDLDLHSAICRGARNPALRLVHEFLTVRIGQARGEGVRFAPDIERMRGEHLAIVDAIVKREPQAAEKAMREHLDSAGLDYVAEGGR